LPLGSPGTDVVVLASGDRITGEVKKLERGKLKYKTDEIGVGKGSKTTNGTLSRSEASGF